MSRNSKILEWLAAHKEASHNELTGLIASADNSTLDYAAGLAREIASEVYGRKVYLRGLVEISNRCACGCYYCGLRAENCNVERYALSEEEIVRSCGECYVLGLRSFVLQSGEVHDRAEEVARVVRRLKEEYSDASVTLSLGEQPIEVYDRWRKAGADRYLLRHETATPEHYARLHPARQTYESRMRCLRALRSLGYQVGAGFMVGSPYQTEEELAREVEYLLELRPEMVGIGPFIPQHSTPFADMPRGGVEKTLLMVSLVRLALPKALIPSTTALASSDDSGMVRGILAGANVVMPNITPERYRPNYAIYDGKKSVGTESGEGIELLRRELAGVGYTVAMERGDHPDYVEKTKS